MELAAPITVYWDLVPEACADESLLRICSDIAECRPLMLQLYYSSPQPCESLLVVLDHFRKTSIAVSLTIIPDFLKHFDSSMLNGFDISELLLFTDDPEEPARLPRLPNVGLSCAVVKENWRRLPELVSACRRHGISRLVLPMQRLYGGETPFFLSKDEQIELRDALKSAGGTDGINLTIHDPFLWRAFNPDIPFPQGGCQAANTMITISPDGGVYPCPTLPVRIGELGGLTTLKTIIASPAKKEFRSRLLTAPEMCGGCRELPECRGGCRGRAYVMYGSLDGVDDACK